MDTVRIAGPGPANYAYPSPHNHKLTRKKDNLTLTKPVPGVWQRTCIPDSSSPCPDKTQEFTSPVFTSPLPCVQYRT